MVSCSGGYKDDSHRPDNIIYNDISNNSASQSLDFSMHVVQFHVYTLYIYIRCAVLLCLVVCLILLASFFLPSLISH